MGALRNTSIFMKKHCYVKGGVGFFFLVNRAVVYNRLETYGLICLDRTMNPVEIVLGHYCNCVACYTVLVISFSSSLAVCSSFHHYTKHYIHNIVLALLNVLKICLFLWYIRHLRIVCFYIFFSYIICMVVVSLHHFLFLYHFPELYEYFFFFYSSRCHGVLL